LFQQADFSGRIEDTAKQVDQLLQQDHSQKQTA
jgi:hypothetical protein